VAVRKPDPIESGKLSCARECPEALPDRIHRWLDSDRSTRDDLVTGGKRQIALFLALVPETYR
jgi:hypothetical protein